MLYGFAQVGLSLSQTLPALYGFTFLATFFSIATQVLVPFAAGLASPKSPQVVGTLMSGLFLGILLARSIAGLLSTVWSWHAVYLISGIVILVFAWVMWVKLPVARKSHQLNILQIYGSLFSLAVHQPHLLRRGLAGELALVFWLLFYYHDFYFGE